MVHDLAAATVSTDRQAAADYFSKRCDVGPDVVKLLRTTARDTKPGHHFIEDQQCTVLASQFAHRFEIAGLWRHATHVSDDGLDDHGRDVRVFSEDLFERGGVVEGKRERVLGECGGNARAVGQSECRDTRSGFDQQAVSVTMITTFKLHQLGASGDTARTKLVKFEGC